MIQLRIRAFTIVGLASLMMCAMVASSYAAVWHPSSASVSSATGTFLLKNEGSEVIGYIVCNSTVTGETPQTAEQFVATVNISGCTYNGDSTYGLTYSGPNGPINFHAQKTTWSPSKGPTAGGGWIHIPPGTQYQFSLKTFIGYPAYEVNCTIRIKDGVSHSPGFELAPYLSTLYSPEWGIKVSYAFVEVSGPTASKCGQSSTWSLSTLHEDTYPHLQILEY